MAAKKIAIVVCALSLLQTSFAGSERFWVFSKSNKPTTEEAWDDLSPEEQRVLIQRYQSLKEIPTDQALSFNKEWNGLLSFQKMKNKKCVMFGKNWELRNGTLCVNVCKMPVPKIK